MLIGEQLTMHTTAKFFVGQIIHHIKFDYRGVIFDVDATFRGTDEWYAQMPDHNLPEISRGTTFSSMERTKPRTLQNDTWSRTTRKDPSHTHSSISSVANSKQTGT